MRPDGRPSFWSRRRKPTVEAVSARFWTHVDRGVGDDPVQCWAWRGPVTAGVGVGEFEVIPGYRIPARRAAAELVLQLSLRLVREAPRHGTKHGAAVCGNILCVNPAHAAWTLHRLAVARSPEVYPSSIYDVVALKRADYIPPGDNGVPWACARAEQRRAAAAGGAS